MKAVKQLFVHLVAWPVALAASHAAVADLSVNPSDIAFEEGDFWIGRVVFSSANKGRLCLTNWPALVDAKGNDTLRIFPEAFRTAPACVGDNYVETHTFYRANSSPYTKTWQWEQNADTGHWEFPIDLSLTTEDDNILGGGDTVREVAVRLTETATGGEVHFGATLTLAEKDDDRVNVRARHSKRNGKIRLYVSGPVADYTLDPSDPGASYCIPDKSDPSLTGALCLRVFINGDGWHASNQRLLAALVTQQQLADSHADGYWLVPFTVPDFLYDCSVSQVTATLAASAYDPDLRLTVNDKPLVKVRSNAMKFCKE